MKIKMYIIIYLLFLLLTPKIGYTEIRFNFSDTTFWKYRVKAGSIKYKTIKDKKVGIFECFFDNYGAKECTYYHDKASYFSECKIDSIQYNTFTPLVTEKRRKDLPFELVNFRSENSSSIIREDSLAFLPFDSIKYKNYKCTRYISRGNSSNSYKEIYVYQGIPVHFYFKGNLFECFELIIFET